MALRRKPGRPKEKLSQDDVEYFEENGLNDSEVELMEQRLKRGAWTFHARAKFCRLNLSQEDDRFTRDGKTIAGRNQSATFVEHRFETVEWEEAKRIYLSEAFLNKRVIDIHERDVKAEEDGYQAFKERVLKDPDRLARLRQDLFSEQEINEDDGSNLSNVHG